MEELAGGKGSAAVCIPLNPPLEEALLMREALLAKRAAAKAKKDSKKAGKDAVSIEADAVQLAADAVVIAARATGSGEKKRSADISVAAVGTLPVQQVHSSNFVMLAFPVRHICLACTFPCACCAAWHQCGTYEQTMLYQSCSNVLCKAQDILRQHSLDLPASS